MKVHELRKGATYTNASGKDRRRIVSIIGDTHSYPGQAIVYYVNINAVDFEKVNVHGEIKKGGAVVLYSDYAVAKKVRNVLATTFARWAAKEVKP